jgi:hypothetical protein
LDDREGSTTANTAVIAQYAPNTPKITLKIAVLMIKKATKSALTVTAPTGSHPVKIARLQIFNFIRI